MPPIADLRSDTVTRPTPAMIDAMCQAELGDDVLGDDPTVEALQSEVAELLGKDAALFTPSGTMANQLAIRAQTTPGDEVFCHEDSHVLFYESGAPAALSGVHLTTLSGDRGHFDVATLSARMRPCNEHFPPARLLVIENTHNRGGGSIWPIQQLADVSAFAHERQLRVHLDGARLMNACVASGAQPVDIARHVDTVSMCFSKGLGAPVGSILAGSTEVIHLARRYRKMFGGGMRQVGLLAAAARYALQHHVDRLADDHRNARHLAERLAGNACVSMDPSTVQTNILYFEIDSSMGTASEACRRLHEAGVWVLPESAQRIRAVTHLDVTLEQIDRAADIIPEVLSCMA
jgi:threonine aldolase